MIQFVPNGYLNHRQALARVYRASFVEPSEDSSLNASLTEALAVPEQPKQALWEKAPPRSIAPRHDRFVSNAKERGPLEKELARLRHEARRKTLSACLESPEAYLFIAEQLLSLNDALPHWETYFAKEHDRRFDKVVNDMLQGLVDQTVFGYSPVELSASALSWHKALNLPMPGALEAAPQLAVWVKPAGREALIKGSISWAYSQYDSFEERDLFFKEAEIDAAFPALPAAKNKGQRKVPLTTSIPPWYQENYPDGHHSVHTFEQVREKAEADLGRRVSVTSLRNAIRTVNDS